METVDDSKRYFSAQSAGIVAMFLDWGAVVVLLVAC